MMFEELQVLEELRPDEQTSFPNTTVSEEFDTFATDEDSPDNSNRGYGKVGREANRASNGNLGLHLPFSHNNGLAASLNANNVDSLDCRGILPTCTPEQPFLY